MRRRKFENLIITGKLWIKKRRGGSERKYILQTDQEAWEVKGKLNGKTEENLWDHDDKH